VLRMLEVDEFYPHQRTSERTWCCIMAQEVDREGKGRWHGCWKSENSDDHDARPTECF